MKSSTLLFLPAVGVLGAAAVLFAADGNAQTMAPAARPTATAANPGAMQRIDVSAVKKITPGMKRPTGLKPADLKLDVQPVMAERPFTATVAKRPKTIINSCEAAHLKLQWPLAGEAGTTWVTHNYTDLDPGSNKRDFKGAVGDMAMNYDGHRGYDIDVGSFRQMDGNLVHARAAAPGVVVGLENSQPDRNTSCTGSWNYVAVKHLNGFVTYYGHLKKNSITVSMGSQVTAGQPLGVVGSSGCSTYPHLHFEVHDCENDWLDAATVQGMWQVHLPSLEVSGVLDVMVREGAWGDLSDPPANITSIKKGRTLGIGLSAAMRGGDELSLMALTPGIEPISATSRVSGRYAHRFPRWSFSVGSRTGPLQIAIWLNDTLVDSRTITVTD